MLNLKDIRGFYLFSFLSLALLFALTASASDYQKSAASKTTPTQYLIEVSHTPEECLAALDETKAMGADKLNQWNFGCMFGNHTGYCIVNAKSETEALSQVPSAERSKAKAFPLTKFTVEQIESFHAMHQ